jgi:hypothetical protein
VASSRVNGLRTIAALVVIAGLAWVGYETVRAGNDIPPQPPQALTQLSGGRASDKRVDGKSWSLDYDRATMSADGTMAEIDGIHDGIINRNGKPYMHVHAKHISANLAQNDFVATGPVKFDEIGGEGKTLATTGAHYMGYSHTLELPNRTTIHSGPVVLTVESATINFDTGATTLGRIVGAM